MLREHRTSELIFVEPYRRVAPGSLVTLTGEESLDSVGLVISVVIPGDGFGYQALVWWSDPPMVVGDFDNAVSALNKLNEMARFMSTQTILDQLNEQNSTTSATR